MLSLLWNLNEDDLEEEEPLVLLPIEPEIEKKFGNNIIKNIV